MPLGRSKGRRWQGSRRVGRPAARPTPRSKNPQAIPLVAFEPEPSLPLEPLTPAFLLKSLGDLRVPTIALPAEVVTVDGRSVSGRIFVPATAHNHDGAMRAEEWMNEPAEFFPFLPDDSREPVLLNRHEILVLTVPVHADARDVIEETRLPERSVVIECGGRRLGGTLLIDMPEEQSRVLDYLNRPGRFVTLRDGVRHHLVQKNRITRVQETRKE